MVALVLYQAVIFANIVSWQYWNKGLSMKDNYYIFILNIVW